MLVEEFEITQSSLKNSSRRIALAIDSSLLTLRNETRNLTFYSIIQHFRAE